MTDELPGGGPARVVARLAKQVERALAEVDLSLAQYRLLGNLAHGPSLPSTLAERLIVSRPSVTALADGLVERGLVARAAAEGDRRHVLHRLTEDGVTLLATADEAIERRLHNVAGHLSDADRARAFRGLDSWGRALDVYRAETVKEKVTG